MNLLEFLIRIPNRWFPITIKNSDGASKRKGKIWMVFLTVASTILDDTEYHEDDGRGYNSFQSWHSDDFYQNSEYQENEDVHDINCEL